MKNELNPNGRLTLTVGQVLSLCEDTARRWDDLPAEFEEYEATTIAPIRRDPVPVDAAAEVVAGFLENHFRKPPADIPGQQDMFAKGANDAAV